MSRGVVNITTDARGSSGQGASPEVEIGPEENILGALYVSWGMAQNFPDALSNTDEYIKFRSTIPQRKVGVLLCFSNSHEYHSGAGSSRSITAPMGHLWCWTAGSEESSRLPASSVRYSWCVLPTANAPLRTRLSSNIGQQCTHNYFTSLFTNIMRGVNRSSCVTVIILCSWSIPCTGQLKNSVTGLSNW